jgi:hypothetical protein
MYIAQFYVASPADKARIIALAELLSCEYRTVENILAVQVDDDETLNRLRTGVPSIHTPGVFCVAAEMLMWLYRFARG